MANQERKETDSFFDPSFNAKTLRDARKTFENKGKEQTAINLTSRICKHIQQAAYIANSRYQDEATVFEDLQTDDRWIATEVRSRVNSELESGGFKIKRLVVDLDKRDVYNLLVTFTWIDQDAVPKKSPKPAVAKEEQEEYVVQERYR